MARRRRAVERAKRRQSITDRVVAGLLVVVAASGLMSMLPGANQRAVARFACQVGSLGLGACASGTLVLSINQLSPPRCSILATLDNALPEVRVSRVVTSDGLTVNVATARSGDTVVTVGPPDESEPPFVLEGEPRTGRTVAPGAQVPNQTGWLLPGGQGGDTIVQAVHDRRRQWVQQRSSLAVLSATLDRGGREIPDPTIIWSRTRLEANVFPHFPADPRPPSTGIKPPLTGRTALTGFNYVAVVPSHPAVVEFNRVTRESSIIADLEGVVDRAPVSGSVRWTRDSSGLVSSVLFGIASSGRMVPGEPQGSTSTGLTYIFVPVRSAAERDLAQSWLSDAGGFRVDLSTLLGLRAPDASDQLDSFLARAATVTVLRYADLDLARGVRQLSTELIDRRRVEVADATLLRASSIQPEPDRQPRALATDPTCTA